MDSALSDVVVIFDLDGTLIDTAMDLAMALNHTLKLHNAQTVAPSKVRHLVGSGAKTMIAAALDLNGAPALTETMAASYLHEFLIYYENHIADYSSPFDDMENVVQKLRSDGAKIAICTNKREAPARALIDALNLTAKFDCIIGSDTIAIAKPNPEPVRLCLAQTGRTKGVFIGDSDTDIRAANHAGMHSIIATFGYGPLNVIEDAYAQFDHYRALPTLIDHAVKL